MKVLIGTARFELDVDRVLGEGGEAVVVEHPTRPSELAVKLYRAAAGAPFGGASRGKLEVLRALGPSLPFAAMPEELVLDDTGALRGFVMRRLAGASEPLAALSSAGARRRMGLSLRDVLALFEDLAGSLEQIHWAGVVVGDLNDQNELFLPRESAVTWIDTDSFQVEGFPCSVSTPLTLDPMLYGPSQDSPWLTADGKPRWFSRSSDWYAFTVLLFRALTGVHPFGGVGLHGANIVRRARARESVFDAKVVLPRTSRRRIEALDHGLAQHFDAVFSRAQRRPLADGELARCARGIRVCGCGEERFGDGACVQCGTGATASAGGVLDVSEWLSHGLVTLVAVDARGVRVLVKRGERLVVVGLGSSLDAREEFAIDLLGATPVALSSSHALFSLEDARGEVTLRLVDLATRTSEPTGAEQAFGAPACALSPQGLVRIVRGHVLSQTARGEALLATVMRNQTRVMAGPSGLVLRTLAFGGVKFVSVADGKTEPIDVPAVRAGERLLEERVFCEAPEPTVVRRVSRGAEELLVWTRGARTTSHSLGAPASFSLVGAVLREDSLLVTTDAGIARISLATGLSVVLTETEPHVSSGDALLAHGTSLYVVTQQRIRRLSRRTQEGART